MYEYHWQDAWPHHWHMGFTWFWFMLSLGLIVFLVLTYWGRSKGGKKK